MAKGPWKGMKEREAARFLSSWTPEPNTGCWLWLGPITAKGYGLFSNRIMRGKKAHRYSWTLRNGPIPEGMVVDHICRERSCVNPDHLRLATPRENALENSLSPTALNARKTHCPNGHAYDEENTHTYPLVGGWGRKCRACGRMHHNSRYALQTRKSHD